MTPHLTYLEDTSIFYTVGVPKTRTANHLANLHQTSHKQTDCPQTTEQSVISTLQTLQTVMQTRFFF